MILDDIAAKTRIRVDKAKAKHAPFEFENALKKPGLSFICEVKKASPSKGIIAEHFPYLEIAKAYEDAGAAAISVLTEPDYFLGRNEYLIEIAEVVNLPLLRKEFIIDEYQIYESAFIEASAVLLIVALLDGDKLKHFIKVADSLGLSALVETHSEDEIKTALSAGARIIGVNNRDLNTFEVDVTTASRLRSLVPKDVVFVAESGVSTRADIERLGDSVDAVLIGEAIMKSADKKAFLDGLRGIS